MTGYTRQDTSNNIANGNVVDADDLDGEFNAVEAAFNSSTGHNHDGTSGEGSPITVVGPAQDIVTTSLQMAPKTNNTYDLGSATNKWKDLYVDGVAYVDAINLNGTAITSTATELNILDGVTVTASEINVLDGITASTAELNILDGVTTTASELNILDGVTATTTELNYLSGVTSSIQTQLDGKQALDAGLTSIAGLLTGSNKMIYTTASDVYAVTDLTAAGRALLDDASAAAQLVTLGLTATAAELNVLDGITSTVAELNILDGVTATAAELNVLDGITASTSELNILDGVTASTTELNYLTGVTSSIQTQLDAKAPVASPTFTGIPAAPTATVGTNTTQIATTAFVQSALSGSGLGDMLKAVYDSNNDGYVNKADTWTTPRTVTVGSTGKSVDGSADVSWSLSEIGVGSGTLTLNTSGIATGSQTFGANQGTNATFTVTVPATDLSVTAGTTAGPTINSSTGTNVVIPSASATASGVVTTGSQTFAGTKTFSTVATTNLTLGGSSVTASAAEINHLVGVTSAVQTQLNNKQALDAGLTSISGLTTSADKMIYTTASDVYAVTGLTAAGRALLDDANAASQLVTLGLTATAAELNTLDGITATVTELNYVDGVTSSIQTQLDAKQPLDSDLTAVSNLATTGIVVRTGTGTAATRAVAAGTGLTVSNGTGVSGNPTLSADIASQAEAEAGTDNTKLMTALRTKQAIDALSSTSAVLSAIAGATAGDVGTYIFARGPSGTTFGSVVAGSSLVYAGAVSRAQISVSNPGSTAILQSFDINAGASGVPSGSWRCMGYISTSASGTGISVVSGSTNGATLWLRIS